MLRAMDSAAAENDIVRELMRDVDRTLLGENLKLTPQQGLEKFASFMRTLVRSGSELRVLLEEIEKKQA
jgi:hypothetical protein